MKIIEIEDFVKSYKVPGVAGKMTINGECIALTGKTRGEISIKLHINENRDEIADNINLIIDNDCKIESGFTEIRNSSIGYVLKQYGMCESNSVYANALFPIFFSNKFRHTEYKQRCLHVLELCGIAGLAKDRLFNLSDSEKFRVSIARAIINNPDVIVIDEPSIKSDNIDFTTVIEMFIMLNKLGKLIIIIPDDFRVEAYMERKQK